MILDNFSNATSDIIPMIELISEKKVTVIEGDIRNEAILKSIFERFPIQAVLHFAALKAVGESVREPIEYYENNVVGSLNLLKVMTRYGVKRIVFSSSATVYGDIASRCLTELDPVGLPTNPYGMTKLVVENILRDIYRSDGDWDIAILRYFNPVGAHKSGLIGESPIGVRRIQCLRAFTLLERAS